MVRYCVVCGRRLRTGIKYCHEHRYNHSEEFENGHRYSGEDLGFFGILILIFLIICGIPIALMWIANNIWLILLPIFRLIVFLSIFSMVIFSIIKIINNEDRKKYLIILGITICIAIILIISFLYYYS